METLGIIWLYSQLKRFFTGFKRFRVELVTDRHNLTYSFTPAQDDQNLYQAEMSPLREQRTQVVKNK